VRGYVASRVRGCVIAETMSEPRYTRHLFARGLGVILWSVLGAFALVSCSSDKSPSEPTELPEQKKASIEYWEQTQFVYDDTASFPYQCSCIGPGEGFPTYFECDNVLIGLQQGLGVEDIDDLLDAISGVVTWDRTHWALPWVGVQVPPKTEQPAILTALRDPRTRSATVNVLGPGVP
jgi:hypothetical protein